MALGSKQIYIKAPDARIRYRAELFKASFIEDHLFEEWLTKEEAIDYLINLGLIPKNYEEEIKSLDKSIDNLKMDLFKNYTNPSSLKQIKKKIREVENLKDKYITNLHYLDRYTIDGSAEIAKMEFIIKNSAFNEKNKKIRLKNKYYVDRIINEVYKQSSTVKELREFARTDPWRSYWATKKQVFTSNVANWTDEQKTLYAFSYMYDGAYKHPECPPDMVINDDDLFDGWQLVMKEKYEQEKRKAESERANGGKNAYSHESFVPVKRYNENGQVKSNEEIKDEVKTVYKNNSLESKLLIQDRQAALAENGRMREGDMPDVQAEKISRGIEAMRQHYGK